MVLLSATRAGAQDRLGDDGHGLARDCGEALQIFDARLEDPLSLNTVMLCRNYIKGFVDGYRVHNPGDVCFRTPIAHMMIARAVVRWLDLNVTWRDLPRADVMHAVLLNEYPCSSPATPAPVPPTASPSTSPKSKTPRSR
jgi:hypothetical protein